ncbi:flavin-dependent oxidoreductase, F420-dependent methylene-tetrahydromethanopterin reductase [Thaumarchaeota archaeon SCGC AB-539-E09]|nr:flavin-dependent oxidoreductase, F420-dependent methylene-tetrahydromethanopterin reductase [Thaumarchaeota archaeon SCGC AB-539-E09]
MARSLVVASPIPCPAPVTIATLPVKDNIFTPKEKPLFYITLASTVANQRTSNYTCFKLSGSPHDLRNIFLKNVKFGVRLSRVISAVPTNNENPNLTPYERIYWPLVKEVALECERLEFDSVILPDHPMVGLERYACWSTLSALAAVTNRLTVGTLTTNTMRYLPNPSLFIKEIATLDHISDGRLYPLGLGLGWTPDEYKAFGFPFPAHKKRLAQLRETIEMMKIMFTEERATYNGKHFEIENLVCEPKPAQNPFPICIGARGKRTLRLAADYADHIDIYGGMDLKDLEDKLNFIENRCTETGRDYEDIVKSWGSWFWIYEDEKELERHRDEVRRLEALMAGRPAIALMGTPEEIVAHFEELKEIGMTYFTLRFEDLPSKRGLRLFAEHVIPEFK